MRMLPLSCSRELLFSALMLAWPLLILCQEISQDGVEVQ